MNILRISDSFHPYAIITIIFWSLAYVLTRLTLQYFSVFSLGFLRYFVASCTLLIFAFLSKMKPPCKRDFLWFLGSGAFGFFFYMITFNTGMKTVTASTSSVIIATVPIITALLARFIYKEELKNFQWAAIVIEFIGVMVLTLMNGVFSTNTGLFWLLLAALALSIYNLLQRKLTKTYTALQTSAFSIFFGTILLTIFLPASVNEAMEAPTIQLFYIAILGIFSSAVAYVAWSNAFAKAKQTSLVSNYMFLTPFLTSALGFVVAKEIPDFATLIGGGIIIFGILLFYFGDKAYIKLN
ncbi:MAG: DMT family transporter [Veillonellales bacterium]